MKRFALALFISIPFYCQTVKAQNQLEVGTGWQNTGASYSQTWRPSLQGSRKDVPAYIGWRRVGRKRVYYSPFARLIYTNFWSIGGGGNLISAGVSPLGIGVYLNRPPSSYSAEELKGKWLISMNANAVFRFGVNVTPHGPKSDRIPDPIAYKDTLQQYLNSDPDLFTMEQHYAFGEYSYVSVAAPVQLQFTKMVRSDLGIGFFLESSVVMYEWSFEGNDYPAAFGYNMLAGVNVLFGPKSD